MPKLIFITIFGYYPWGGSEELWQKTAIYAASKGFEVEAHIFTRSKDHPKVKELIKNNVKVIFRKDTISLLDRVARKAGLKSVNSYDVDNYWKKNLTDPNAIYIVSGGTTLDCVNARSLFDEMIAK